MKRVPQLKVGIFQGLAHKSRIQIVELLRDGELSVNDLAEKLELEQTNVSQHLSILKSKHIVIGRKTGTQVFYSLCDPVFIEVLDLLKAYLTSHLSELSLEVADYSA